MMIIMIVMIIIDVACPLDTGILQKEQEKVKKYQDLKREIKRIWKCQDVVIIPVWGLGDRSRQL